MMKGRVLNDNILISFIIAILCCSSNSFSAENDSSPDASPGIGQAKLFRAKDRKKRIRGLIPRASKLQVGKKDGADGEAFVVVQGKFSQRNWALLNNARPVGKRVKKGYRFSIETTLTGKVTRIPFQAIGPRGEVQQETWIVHFPDFATFEKKRTQKEEEKKEDKVRKEKQQHFLIVSLGGSSVSYQEEGLSEYSMLALTGKLSYSRPIINRNFSLGGNIFINMVPLNSSPSGASARFFGINLRLGYRVPFISSPWSFNLSIGPFVSIMLTDGTIDDSAFGYTPLIFPQIFPVLSRKISRGNSVYIYGKYVPLSRSFNPLKFDEREIAAGVGWIHILGNYHPMVFTIDYSNMSLVLPNTAGEDLEASVTSVSIGLGYGI